VLGHVREDHAALQDAHRTLVAKDLMKSGLLKDRWVGGGMCVAYTTIEVLQLQRLLS
jgi:hypothetical protein